jgi:hypothetical protein
MTPAFGTPTLLQHGRFDGISDSHKLDGVSGTTIAHAFECYLISIRLDFATPRLWMWTYLTDGGGLVR